MLQQTPQSVNLKIDLKLYSSSTRMMLFDPIVNQVPTAKILVSIRQSQIGAGEVPESIPIRSTVELMAKELGSISEMQTAEKLVENKNLTIGFDATTQEGKHVNQIHFTTETDCLMEAVELASGTANN